MSLEEELAINQFGQGALPEADLLDSFAQLDASKQRKRFVRLYYYVSGPKLATSAVDEAITECSLTENDPIYAFLNLAYLKVGSRGIVYKPCMEEPPGGDLAKPYQVLLNVFKADYQRRYSAEKDNPTKWWYRDFSNQETALNILTTYRRLSEEIYANASYRSEFTAMAKLWHTNHVYEQALADMPPAEPRTSFDFLAYDQITKGHAWMSVHDTMRACTTLRHSVEKALYKQYRLDMDETRRITLGVIDRHLQETFSHRLYEE